MATALVTGCSKGVGLATAVRLAKDGWRVVATMRNPPRDADRLLQAAEAAGVHVDVGPLDVTDDESVHAAFAAAGPVDLLVNNAAVMHINSVEETPLEDWQQVIDANLYGTLRCTRAALPGMRERCSGCIINITTMAVPAVFGGIGPYAVSKAAIEQLSEVVAIEGRPYGVRVVVVEPGLIASMMQPVGTPASADSPYSATMRNTFAFIGANREWASDPDVIADTVARAASGETPFRAITGQAADQLLGLRRGHTDDEWHTFVSSEDFEHRYRAPQVSTTPS